MVAAAVVAASPLQRRGRRRREEEEVVAVRLTLYIYIYTVHTHTHTHTQHHTHTSYATSCLLPATSSFLLPLLCEAELTRLRFYRLPLSLHVFHIYT